jgi:hypothetical protein
MPARDRARDHVDDPGRAQLLDRHVDRHAERATLRIGGGPPPEFGAGLVENPRADLDDHVGVLGQRDELSRSEHAPLRVSPPDQRLGADQLVV